ncbi:MAG: hypothetical protein GY754_16465 [bacterium]|nr:hypothetical protein [bacterium]
MRRKSKRHTIEDMRQVARKRRGNCLSDKYINTTTKLEWQCRKGHTWKATPHNILMGKWCPSCAWEKSSYPKKKHSLEEMKQIAKDRGGKCLSREYISYEKKLKWKCKEGHTWSTTAATILGGAWCPSCALKPKWTIGEMREIARERGGECLSRKYTNSLTKLKWRCEKGHTWETAPESILKGTWCRDCAWENNSMLKASHTLKEMKQIAKDRGGKCLSKEYKSSQKKLKWQCGEGHTWQTTPYVILNGSWCPRCAGVGKLTIGEMREIARKRGGKCLSEKYINTHTKLTWQCKEGHTWEAIPNNVKIGKWCPDCFGTKKSTILEMREMARKRGGKCLSEKYINTKTKLKWQCKEGHTWMALPSNVVKGTWCLECSGKRKPTISEMKKLARSRGGKCLSNEYINGETKLTWQCKDGHIWKATPRVIRCGSWCPECRKNKPKKSKK